MTETQPRPVTDLMDLTPFIEGRENEIFAWLRQHEPMHWNDEPDGPGFWSVTRYADLMSVINDPVTFVNGEGTQILSRKVEGGTSTVHNTDPPRHTKLRKLATPHLRAVKIREWQDMIDAAVSDILDSISGPGPVELVGSASALLPIRVLGQVLGVPAADCGLLLDWTNRIISDDPEFMRSADEKARAREEMFGYFQDLTKERRRQPQGDLISKLVQATIDGEQLSWEDLAAYYFVLVGAGNETTRNLITGAVLAFAEFPGEWDRLAADPALLRPAVEETLRYVTPIRAMRRTAAHDTQLLGQPVREGEKVVLWFQSANRDPEIFGDPDAFRIDRAPNPHVGFGWGIHACLGSHLARAEATSFFRGVLDRGLQITPIAPPERLHTNHFHAFKRLNVSVTGAGPAAGHP